MEHESKRQVSPSSGGDVEDNSTPEVDERAFNETLKRMLKTPPDPAKRKSELDRSKADRLK